MRQRQLHRGGADAAARAVDEDGFAGLCFGFKMQRDVGGGVGDVDGRALFEADAVGEPVDLPSITEAEFGVRAGHGAGNVDAFA